VELHSFDDLYANGATFNAVYAGITQKIMELGRRDGGVVYAVPGHPFVAERTGPEIVRLAHAEGLSVRVVAGLSFLEPTFSALDIDPFPQLTLCDALSLGPAHAPTFPPDTPVLIAQLYSRLVASEVKSTLGAVYADQHRVKFVHRAGTAEEVVEDLALFEIDRSDRIGALTSLYVPPLDSGSSAEAVQAVVAHLRAPEGCPWDREQTHKSLRRHLLEESYEAISAMDSGDHDGMREEFGDLLLQIVLNAQIASELGEFTFNDVSKGVHDKIVRRHPHVFGDLQLAGVDGVLTNWEKLKEDERAGKSESDGLLEGVPTALPALSQAQEYQDRAARVGFDSPGIEGVLSKIAEEIGEVKGAQGSDQLAGELGDLFFALVNLARWKGVDAEAALRQANHRFFKRFSFVEQGAKRQTRRLTDLSLDEMNALWQEAKGTES
jgi:tetrapyrrole methylase family protein/MazG family protein